MIDNKNQYINLYSTCKLVKGKKRGTITDLQRNRIELVPNELIDIIETFNHKKISDIYINGYSSSDLALIEEYLDFLVDNEVIFLSMDISNFRSHEEVYAVPKKLLSAIIDIDANRSYNIPEAIQKIDAIGCDNLQIRFYDYVIPPDKLAKIVSLFCNTSYRYIEVLLPYAEQYMEEYQQILSSNNRISLVYLHSYSQADKIIEKEGVRYIYTSEKIVSSDFCGYIMPFYFDISPSTYYLGEQYNTCLYKKIAVDVHGIIKNCPSMKYGFGKIDTVNIEEIITTPKFRRFWDITKDKISVCKSCEFRKICTDCRAYQTEDTLYEKPKHCDYDPEHPNW